MWLAVILRLLVVLGHILAGVCLGNRKHLFVPLEAPFILLIADFLVIFWLLNDSRQGDMNRVLLVGLLLIGFLRFVGNNGKRRWYLLKTGGFHPLDPLYDDVAQALRNHLWLRNLPPASVVLYKDGRIGFLNMNAEQRMLIETLLKEKLDERQDLSRHQNWRRFLWVHFWCLLAILIGSWF